ncbi:hypothetical protein E2C01_081131 [Portunus trituberculatus]|uniref:Uncharacterized protein n=1 Tax=Portunus trituberculatus TaxID=210409 RepID=A0A5B7J096_PORTR|nr:hypothetical protein [Portunus trituberculatus]
MATSTASVLASPPYLPPASRPKTCPAESQELDVENEEDSFSDMVILASGSCESRSTSPSVNSDCSEAEVMAAAPDTLKEDSSWGREVQQHKGMVEDNESTENSELDQVHEDCTAAIACTEAFPVVFACSVEQVRAAEESDVQCSLRIYRQEASIILRQPRVMDSIRAFNHRDGVSHEGGEVCDSFSCDSQDSSEGVVKLHESLSQADCEENSAGDEEKSGAMPMAEKEEDDPGNTPGRHGDSLAPILLLLAAAAGAALVAAVVQPFGANLSSGIIAIAVFFSLSKWHTPPMTGENLHGPATHARPHRIQLGAKTVHYSYFLSFRRRALHSHAGNPIN